MKQQKFGAIFPGQGSQFVGMGKFLCEEFKLAKQTFEEADDTLKLKISRLCFDGPLDQLTLTENTQPALLTSSVSLFRVLQAEFDFAPSLAAGHSLGEYSALVAAQTLSFSDALTLVRKRGEFMQQAVPVGTGAMLALLGPTEEEAGKICQWAEKESGLRPVEPANFNSPGQVVLSGNAKAIQFLRENFKAEAAGITSRVKMIPLNVSAPFHCSLMKPAEEKMRLLIEASTFLTARFAVIQNLTAEPEMLPLSLRENLIQQISSPVRWSQSVTKMKELGTHKFIEVGPGRVLNGLLKKIDGEGLSTFNIESIDDLKKLEVELKNS